MIIKRLIKNWFIESFNSLYNAIKISIDLVYKSNNIILSPIN